MSQFLMPSLGADMEAGTLVEWLVLPGAPVRRGDVIAVVETQKGAIEIEIFEDGVFERSLVEIGDKVPVGEPLAYIRHTDEPAEAAKPERASEEAQVSKPAIPPVPAEAGAAPIPTPVPVPRGDGVKISPAARQLAARSGIDFSTLTGTGPEGAITLADVSGHVAKPGPAPSISAKRTEDPFGGMRAAIAAAMSRSKREIPHYYLAHTMNLTTAQAWLADCNATRDPLERLLMGTLFVKAVARAVKKFPEFNGHFIEGAFVPSEPVHVGIAVNIRGGGLVAPAIHDADTIEVNALMAGMRDLVMRVRAGRFRSSEIADSTITISSLGERGVESLYGIIYPPQVAIMGFGMPVTRAWVVDGAVAPCPVVTITLAGDHRVSDGHRGALFLNAIEQQLLQPEAL